MFKMHIHAAIHLLCVLIIQISSVRPVSHQCPGQPMCRCHRSSYAPDRGYIVDCSNSSLVAVPKTLPRDTVELDLSWNPIDHLWNHSFDRLPKLTHLTIDDAQLKMIEVRAFSKLVSLEFLSLLRNPDMGIYTGKLKISVFAPLQKLRELHIYGNVAMFDPNIMNMTYPTNVLAELRHLDTLQIDGLPSGVFGSEMKRLTRLTNLFMSGINGYCNVPHIGQYYFSNVPNVRKLTIQKCGLIQMNRFSLCELRDLFKVDLSYNMDLNMGGFQELSYCLQNSNIKELYIIAIHRTFGLGVPLKKSHIQWLKNTPLIKLDISSNRLEAVEDGALSDLPVLIEMINLADNKLTYGTYILESQSLKNIKYINMSLMSKSHSPLTGSIDPRLWCSSSQDSHTGGETIPFPHTGSVSKYDAQQYRYYLTRHGLTNNDSVPKKDISATKRTDQPLVSQTLPIPVPKSLIRILGSDMTLNYIIPEINFQENMVDMLDISSNLLHSWEGPIRGLEKLRILNMATNFCSKVSPYFFDEMVGLEILSLDNNLLGFMISDDKHWGTFKNLVKLQYLNLAQNRLSHVPDKLFINLRKLMHLDLSSNILSDSDLDFNVEQLSKLKVLNLADNVLSSIPLRMRTSLDKLGSQLKLIIKNNKLQCNCDTLGFLEWIQSTEVKISLKRRLHCEIEGKRTYFTEIDGIVTHLGQQCRDYVPFILVGVSCISGYIIGILLMVIYRYRWKLRYIYYVGRARFYQAEHEGEYLYDAFISYAEEDKPFINNMVERLEKKAKLKLCIHERNFTAGKTIQYNITACIHNSRKVICILTSSFFKRHWCQYEFHMARIDEMHTGRDVLILVNLSYFPRSVVPQEIKEQMVFASYTKYPNALDEESRELFWANLIKSIKDS